MDWTTLKYRDPNDTSLLGRDIEMYDISTGIYRRITTEPNLLQGPSLVVPP